MKRRPAGRGYRRRGASGCVRYCGMAEWTHALLGSYLALMVLAVAWLHRDLLIAAAADMIGGAWPAAAAGRVWVY